MTLIEAQTRYMTRIRDAHPGHRSRVQRSARKQLGEFLEKMGVPQIDRIRVIRDAHDMLVLEGACDE